MNNIDWVNHNVSDPDPSLPQGFTLPSRTPFSTIGHASHTWTAKKILADKEVRPGLVFDKSVLREERILVSWFSPNYWSTGFRYGNILFRFPITDFIEGKNFYAIEKIDYQIPALRILVTERDRSTEFQSYDPLTSVGPWRCNELGEHFFNNNVCVEFMVEDSVSLSDSTKIDAVKHHPDFCSINRNTPGTCGELGNSSNKGAGIFMARLVANRFNGIDKMKYFRNQNTGQFDLFDTGFNDLSVQLAMRTEFSGTLGRGAEHSERIARASLHEYSLGSTEDAIALAQLFKSQEDYLSTIRSLLAQCFGTVETSIFASA